MSITCRTSLALVLTAACVRRDAPFPAAAQDSAATAALRAVLVERERARRVVVWRARLGDGAPLTELADVVRRDRARLGAGAAGRRRPVEAAQLAPGVPVAVIDEAALAALFARAPDGWRAFFRAHPGASGIAELSHPLRVARDTAVVHVARQCGEQCASLFRVRVARGAAGGWRAVTVEALPTR